MAKKISISTAKKVVPMIYAYTTPEIERHDGWTKIGYTERDVITRIEEQTRTANVKYKLEWQGTAIFDDGTGDTFRDTEFHAYLAKCGTERQRGEDNEWFRISGADSRTRFYEFKGNRGFMRDLGVVPYTLRDEQARAVERAKNYFAVHTGSEFLWNCKPRFGKTLSVYDLCKQMGAQNVLIVTNRPAIANSWYDDFEKFMGTESGYEFVSQVDGLKGRPLVRSREEYSTLAGKADPDHTPGCIEFVSLQDLKGAKRFGGTFEKLNEVADLNWDVLVIDEAHEGVDTLKTEIAFDHIKRKYTLHLSGTPFRALSDGKFPGEAIFNWTYADEQRAKRDWPAESPTENPYESLPRLNMFTYQLSDIVSDLVEQGVEVEEDTVKWSFDLAEFFSVKQNGSFVHEDAVDCFLDAMTHNEKFPFSTPELRDELRHTFWLLNRVDSCKALKKKLEAHPVFKDYEVVLAAGDGRSVEGEELEDDKAFDRVRTAIAEHDKTITLSVGQLTTGVTVPEWTAVMMLCSLSSPSLYMQTAFRAQNPCKFTRGGTILRKENAYVFDFDPARTLIIYDDIANELTSDTSGGKGDAEKRKQHIVELMNFFPVYGEDKDGEMVELDAEQVLSIPRRLKSREVVDRGFMSNFLFQNIGAVFSAPKEVVDAINSMNPAKDPGPLTQEQTGEVEVDPQTDEVVLEPEQVVGTAAALFGDAVYKVVEKVSLPPEPEPESEKQPKEKTPEYVARARGAVKESVDKMLDIADEKYGNKLTGATRKKLEKKLNAEASEAIERKVADLNIRQNELQRELDEAMDNAEPEEVEELRMAFETKQEEIVTEFTADIQEAVEELVKKGGETIVRTVETGIQEQKKRTVEDTIRDHLRGFSRTIPSFLMAYGSDHEVTLENFDKVVPDDVFQEVTGITLDQFRFLRDGGDFPDAETGEIKHFSGHLFDPIVFNDSVKEFMSRRKALADYFDEANDKDIFDFIPPQKTNQIFTPKKVVRDMVDRLEQENPGCFDDPDKTFADLYMKSGMYVAEIVRRLYQSERMRYLFPDDEERLNHIFAHQVFGLAPTEIIYRITLSYLLGFTEEIGIKRHNIRLCDSLQYAKEGTLEETLTELFGDVLEA